MDRELLEAAAERGVIDPTQVDALLAFAREREAVDEDSEGEEQLRFVRSFGDIFITLGVLFVSIAMAQLELVGGLQILPIVVLTATAEWLVRVRRLALPGIALLIATLYFTVHILGLAEPLTSGISSAAMAVVGGAWFWRYRMPFAAVPFILGVAGAGVAIGGITALGALESPLLIIAVGLVVFVIAMAFDARDRLRRNYRSDTGFWLHLLAAPLIVHGVMIVLLLQDGGTTDKHVVVLGFFAVFVLVALFIDRRAMLVSSIGYAIAAFAELISAGDFAMDDALLIVFIGVGVFVIAVGAYWKAVRSRLFGRVFGNGVLARYVPPFE